MTVDREHPERWRWLLSVEVLLESVGRLLVSVGLLGAIVGVLVWVGAGRVKPVALGMLIGGASACVGGLVMWGLAAVIVELRRIRSLLEDIRQGRP